MLLKKKSSVFQVLQAQNKSLICHAKCLESKGGWNYIKMVPKALSVPVEVRGATACRITIWGQESGTPAVPNELCDVHRRAKRTVMIIPGWSFSSKIGGGGRNMKLFKTAGFFFFVVLLLISLFECKVPNKRSKLPLDCIYCSWWLQLCVNIRKQQGPAFQESLEQCHEDKCPDWCSHTPQLSCCF